MPLSAGGPSPVPPVGWCQLHLKEDLCVCARVRMRRRKLKTVISYTESACVCGEGVDECDYHIQCMSHDLAQTHQYSD